MKFLTISKFLLVIIFPLLLFLLALNYVSFDNSFYSEKFSEFKIRDSLPNANSLHQKVVDFLRGTDESLPAAFGEKEKQHLLDVRHFVSYLTITLYILVIIFVALLIISAFTLKINNHIANFVGKVLVFGGILTIALASILFFLISSDFPSAFESFHQLFFEKETYLFDPAKEIIVRLYPEQLFMDLGIRVSGYVIASSIIAMLLGAFLLFRSKKQKG